MNIVRPAKSSDFQAIYDLQNVPFRQKVFDSPLPPFEEFLRAIKEKIESGNEYYFLLERDSVPQGFVWFIKTGEYWHTTIWGKWIRTLVYAAGITAFKMLKFPRLVFGVRQENTRMIRVCEDYGFRFAGEASTYCILDEPPFFVLAKLSYYDITEAEFWEKSERMRKGSLELEFRSP